MRELWRALARLKHLHWGTWCAVLLCAVPLVLIMVPGEAFPYDLREHSQAWNDLCTELEANTYEQTIEAMRASGAFEQDDTTACPPDLAVIEHGWPSPYLARAVVDDTPYPTDFGWETTSWMHLDHWPFSAENWVFRPWAFFVDLAICLWIVGIVGGVTQWRIHRRRGLLRFGLSEFLAGLTLLCVGLGYYTYHHRIHQQETRYFDPPQYPGMFLLGNSYCSGQLITWQAYQGPTWLRKLLGGDQYLGMLYHDYHATVELDAPWQSTMQSLTERPFVEIIMINDPLPLVAVDYLERCPRLNTLILPKMDTGTPRQLAGTNDPVFQPEHLSQLKKLALRKLVLRGDALRPQHVEMVAAIPGLRQVHLQGTSLTKAQLQSIEQRYPHVMLTITDMIPFSNATKKAAREKLSRAAWLFCAEAFKA